MKDKVLAIVDGNPNGITARDVTRSIYEFRSSRLSRDPRESLKQMEGEGILISREENPKGGGPISRIYTRDKRDKR